MNRTRLASRSGFTLLEILLVLVIIGMLVGVAVVKIGGKGAEAKAVTTRSQLNAYKNALGMYELDNGFFPSQEQGLNALVQQPTTPPVPSNWKGPYLDPPKIRPDGWGHEFIYRYPGQKLPNGYDLFSPGPDGVPDNEDDIGNWQ